MPVRMTHPDYTGTIHAVGWEVEWNKKYGWVESPETSVVKAEIPAVELAIPKKTKTCQKCGKECKNLGSHLRFCKGTP